MVSPREVGGRRAPVFAVEPGGEGDGSRKRDWSTEALKLSVVIVNFNNDRVLRGCLPSLPEALEGLDAEVILSDNGSSDGSLEWVRANYPQIRILENGANLGFAEANNRAFPLTKGDRILLLNPDTIVEGDAFRPMLDLLDERPLAGAVGCMLHNVDGSRQISVRSFPSLSTSTASWGCPTAFRRASGSVAIP
jgi:GT2 family glycosyltransferase